MEEEKPDVNEEAEEWKLKGNKHYKAKNFEEAVEVGYKCNCNKLQKIWLRL